MESISKAVQKQYDTYPYPCYPLLATPRWQENPGNFVGLSQRLLQELDLPIRHTIGTPHSLVLGSGEIQPYAFRKWHTADMNISCVDFSLIHIARSKIRTLFSRNPPQYHHQEISEFLQKTPNQYEHIDAYGVLHHIPTYQEVFPLLAKALKPGGTMRIMVYNSSARSWIHIIQSIFRLLKLDPFEKIDLKQAKLLLRLLSKHHKSFEKPLAQMGPSILNNPSRLVDSFFHAYEAKTPLKRWLDGFAQNGIFPLGLYDRFGELDHLQNPLLNMPDEQELADLAIENQFRNNWELFFYKALDSDESIQVYKAQPSWASYMKSAPQAWFQFPETSAINAVDRRRIWIKFLDLKPLGKIWIDYPPITWNRLLRLGAVVPKQLTPLQLDACSTPLRRPPIASDSNQVTAIHPLLVSELRKILILKKCFSEARMNLVQKRLQF